MGVKRWLIWLPFVAFAAVLALAAEGLLSPAERVVRSKLIDKPVPAFTLSPMLPDKPGVSTADFGKGEPRLLNVFASWCVPCIAEAPHLMTLRRAGVRIDAIAIRDRPDAIRRFLRTNGDPYASIGDDRTSRVQLSLGSSGVPETFLIDGKGRIVLQHVGDIRADEVPGLIAAVRAAR
jgi:cytochrome c biogenesis protein CcmG/thiol:disulfide interchange protein DsbE